MTNENTEERKKSPEELQKVKLLNALNANLKKLDEELGKKVAGESKPSEKAIGLLYEILKDLAEYRKLLEDNKPMPGGLYTFLDDLNKPPLRELWYAWGRFHKSECKKEKEKGKEGKNPKFTFADIIASNRLMNLLDDTKTKDFFYKEVAFKDENGIFMDPEWNLYTLLDWARKEDPFDYNKMHYLGNFLVKFKDRNDFRIDNIGAIKLIERAQILTAKDEIRKEFKEDLGTKIKEIEQKLKEESKELKEKVEEAKDAENRMTRNFVQIIGIFAAIIAFVVTMVPAAARLGGASIPVALAGLAIVTSGIILLLSMIFGKRENKKASKGLIIGIVTCLALFIIWLFATSWLAIKHPDTLRPPPNAARIDTMYINRIDTVQKTIYVKPKE